MSTARVIDGPAMPDSTIRCMPAGRILLCLIFLASASAILLGQPLARRSAAVPAKVDLTGLWDVTLEKYTDPPPSNAEHGGETLQVQITQTGSDVTLGDLRGSINGREVDLVDLFTRDSFHRLFGDAVPEPVIQQGLSMKIADHLKGTLSVDGQRLDIIYTHAYAIWKNDEIKQVVTADQKGYMVRHPKEPDVVQEAGGIRITLDDAVLFDFDRAELKSEAEAALTNIKARVLDHYPNARLSVEGHTDNIGNDGHNLDLSMRRARSVGNWLSSHGISTARISTKGYGKTRPKVPNTSDENRARNRRVEIVVVDAKNVIDGR